MPDWEKKYFNNQNCSILVKRLDQNPEYTGSGPVAVMTLCDIELLISPGLTILQGGLGRNKMKKELE